MRSSDYNFYYDKGYTVQHIPKQAFGFLLACSNRVLLVGAPYAGYGNHTNHSNVGSVKGIVFTFSSRAHVQQIYFECTMMPVKGSFKLEMFNYTSSVIPYDADSYLMNTALENIPMIGKVVVKTNLGLDTNIINKYRAIWEISFLSQVTDYLPILNSVFKGYDCDDCDSIIFETKNGIVVVLCSSNQNRNEPSTINENRVDNEIQFHALTVKNCCYSTIFNKVQTYLNRYNNVTSLSNLVQSIERTLGKYLIQNTRCNRSNHLRDTYLASRCHFQRK